MTALLLLGPWTPLLFQGQEFGVSSPFLFFADVGDAAVRDGIRKGRAELLAPFLSLTEEETLRTLPAPDDPQTFSRCKLDFSEREKNRELYDLHIDLLKLRREDSRFRQQSSGGIDGAVLGPASFVLRYFCEDKDDRLLIVNFGERAFLHPASEPLLAPPPVSGGKRSGRATRSVTAERGSIALATENNGSYQPNPPSRCDRSNRCSFETYFRPGRIVCLEDDVPLSNGDTAFALAGFTAHNFRR